MSHTPHELHDSFPHAAVRIHKLKQNDAHFARLAEEHHSLNREIHRIETEVEPAGEARLEELKKQRLALLDQIVPYLEDAV